MKVLFVLKYSRDQSSSRVRGFYMAEELRKRGIKCHIIYGYSKKVYMSFLTRLLRYDIIYFQKRYSQRDIQLSSLARLMGKKTIFDIDDAPSGASFSPIAEKQAIEMMKNCSAVVVASHKLRDFAQNFNDHVYLVPTSINLNWYKPREKAQNRSYVTLGWIGNGIDYKRDLLTLIESIEKNSEKYSIKVTIVGALGQKEIHESFGKLKNTVVEIIDSIDWAHPQAVPTAVSGFDVGLYPLLDNEYNRYKGGFKALEYMAMEIPVIASPVAENKFIVEHGRDGFLVSNKNEWKEKLSYLIENESVRKNMGKQGRHKIEKSYSMQVSASKLIDVFENIGVKSCYEDKLYRATS